MESLLIVINLISYIINLSGIIVLEAYLTTVYLLGSIASIIGIPIAIIGVFLSYKAAKKSALEAESSKDASLIAQSEIEKFRNDISLLAQVVDFEKAINIMDDIKSFIRDGVYRPLPEKISSLILLLNKIRTPSMSLSKDDSAKILASVMELRKIEEIVDESANSDELIKQAGSLNKRISNQIDELYPIMHDLKNQIGENHESK